jgi:AcrR family transcriptional regulator
MTDIREKLLEATAAVFAKLGYLGCTTRRVAQEAGVNEVTLFRHFGSKDALIREALAHVDRVMIASLPAEPVQPAEELAAWARQVHENLCEHRQLIRRVMGETVTHPEIAPVVCEGAEGEHDCLARYLEACRARGLAGADFDVHAVSSMLLGALFADAMLRDMMPAILPVEAMVREYVRITVVAIGAVPTSTSGVA